MSYILEALKRAQKERAVREEKDKGFKIASILAPVEAVKKRLPFSKNFILIGILGGLIFLLAFAIFLLLPGTPVRKEARHDITRQDKLEAPPIVETGISSELTKTTPEMELQKAEPLGTSTQETSSIPSKIDKEQMMAQEVSAKPEEVKRKPELKKEPPELKTYARQLPSSKESVPETLTPAYERDDPEQSPFVELNLPKSAIYHFNLGIFYQREGKPEKAKEEYENVISLDPLNAEVHNNLGMVYKDLGKLDKAIAEYRKALALDPQYQKAYYNLAAALYLKGELEAAASEARLAISLDPKDLESYNILSLSYKKRNKNSEAIEISQKALAVDPDHAQTHYNLALLLEEDGKTEEAIFHYQKFIVLSKSENNRNLIEKVQRHLEQLPLQ